MIPGRVVLLGASGQIGLFALRELHARGIEVAAVSRHGRPEWIPEAEGIRWIDASGADTGFAAHAQALVSTGPLGLAAQWLRRLPDVHTVVAFSTTSVLSKRDSRDERERQQASEIAGAERELDVLCGERDATLTLLRPTLVYGCGMDRNLSLAAGWIRRFGFFPVAGAAGGLRQPVHAEDLARAALAAMEVGGRQARITSPLVGGSTLPYREMVRRVFAALDRMPRLVRVPPAVLVPAARLAGMLPGFPPLSPEMIRRQSLDLVFDDELARRTLGVRPRRFHPVAADFALPDLSGLRRA